MLRTMSLWLGLLLLLWVVLWAWVGVAVARARSWSSSAGAALCVTLGPFGLLIVLLMSRPGTTQLLASTRPSDPPVGGIEGDGDDDPWIV